MSLNQKPYSVREHEQHADQGESCEHGEDLRHAVVWIGELWEEHLEKGNVKECAARDALEGAVGNVAADALKKLEWNLALTELKLKTKFSSTSWRTDYNNCIH